MSSFLLVYSYFLLNNGLNSSTSNSFAPSPAYFEHHQLLLQQPDSTTEDSVSTLEVNFLLGGLVNVQKTLPEISVDLKFATPENFTKSIVYNGLKKAYLQKEVVAQLEVALANLKAIHPNYNLLIYDATQPHSAQQKIWDSALKLNLEKGTNHLSNPKKSSIQNYGVAVDITIVDENGKPLDMGTDYFEFSLIAKPKLEDKFLKNKQLTQQQLDNRQLQRQTMEAAGFIPSDTKWWQFEAMSLKAAAKKYSRLE